MLMIWFKIGTLLTNPIAEQTRAYFITGSIKMFLKFLNNQLILPVITDEIIMKKLLVILGVTLWTPLVSMHQDKYPGETECPGNNERSDPGNPLTPGSIS